MNMNRDDQAGPLSERREPRSADEARRRNGARSTGEVAAQSSLHGPTPESARLGPRTSNGLEHSVKLHIEELVLHGFEPAQRYAIGDAIERELTRLFRERGALMEITQDVEIEHLNTGEFEMEPGATPAAIGARLARAIYGGLTK